MLDEILESLHGSEIFILFLCNDYMKSNFERSGMYSCISLLTLYDRTLCQDYYIKEFIRLFPKEDGGLTAYIKSNLLILCVYSIAAVSVGCFKKNEYEMKRT